jgi:hypothetical protein
MAGLDQQFASDLTRFENGGQARGSGEGQGATGYLDYFGMADFDQNTLVLRYRGEVCHPH